MTAPAQDGGPRFAFGQNWRKFLDHVDGERIEQAKRSLTGLLRIDSLEGQTMVDAGCGSGLFSLAALLLGATRVHSFDFDPASVACALELRHRHPALADRWTIEQGSIIDAQYLGGLGQFDLVYSWGVLHHTGDMWRGLSLAQDLVKPGGLLYVAIYNDQGSASHAWRSIKRTYNALSPRWRPLLLGLAFVRLWGPRLAVDSLRGRPLQTWRAYGQKSRGMSAWTDVVDWVGGYPFEVAKPDAIVDFYVGRGFRLRCLSTCGGKLGNNEFVFQR